MVRLITLFLLFCLCSFAASAMPDDPPGIAAAKLLAQRKVDTAAFNNFASICIAADSTALLMDTYRKLLENGQKDIDDADLPFLNALHARINPLHYKYIDFYTCFYTSKILIKYHLDKIAPEQYAREAIEIAGKLNSHVLIVKGYNVLSSYYTNIRHNLELTNACFASIDSLLAVYQLSDVKDCGFDQNKAYSVLYFYLDDYDKSLTYLQKSIARVKDNPKDPQLFDLYVRRSLFELLQERYPAALNSLDSAQRSMSVPTATAMNYLRADSFNVYVRSNDKARALQLEPRVNISDLDGGNDEFYDYLYNLVKLQLEEGLYKKARENIARYTANLKEWNIQRWMNAYEVMYLLHKAEHRPDEALESYEQYTKYKDLVHHQKQNYAVLAQQIKYSTRQKEEQLQLQISKNEVQSENIKIIVLCFVALSLLLLLLLGYKIIVDLREKEKMNRNFSVKLLQNTELAQNRLAHELHDGLGQELLLLKTSLTLEHNKEKAEIVANIIESVRGIARELYPALLEVVGLKTAIENQLHRLDHTEQIFISSAIDFDGKLAKNVELQVYRIFQEAITNVLKYSGATSVLVSLQEKDEVVTLIVKDNGIGFDVQEKLVHEDTFGLQSMRQRAESIDGWLLITSAKDKGTEVTLNFPYYENIDR